MCLQLVRRGWGKASLKALQVRTWSITQLTKWKCDEVHELPLISLVVSSSNNCLCGLRLTPLQIIIFYPKADSRLNECQYGWKDFQSQLTTSFPHSTHHVFSSAHTFIYEPLLFTHSFIYFMNISNHLHMPASWFKTWVSLIKTFNGFLVKCVGTRTDHMILYYNS